MFESNQVDRQVLARAFDAMGDTPEVTFCLLPGNHDPLDAASIYTSNSFRERRPANVVVLDGIEPIEAADGVELLAAPWTSKRPLADLVNRAVELTDPSDALRVVIGHGALDSRSPDARDPALISLSHLEERVSAGEIHYVALGDRHSTTEEGNTRRIWYSGAPEPTDYDEVDPGKVLLVDLDADECVVEPRRVGTWAFELVDQRLSSDADIDTLHSTIDAVTDKERTVLKLALVGQITLMQSSRLDSTTTNPAWPRQLSSPPRPATNAVARSRPQSLWRAISRRGNVNSMMPIETASTCARSLRPANSPSVTSACSPRRNSLV